MGCPADPGWKCALSTVNCSHKARQKSTCVILEHEPVDYVCMVLSPAPFKSEWSEWAGVMNLSFAQDHWIFITTF